MCIMLLHQSTHYRTLLLTRKLIGPFYVPSFASRASLFPPAHISTTFRIIFISFFLIYILAATMVIFYIS